MYRLRSALVSGAVIAAAAAGAIGQVVADAVPLVSNRGAPSLQQQLFEPAGPGDLHDVHSRRPSSTFSTDPQDSVFNNLDRTIPEGGWAIPQAGPHQIKAPRPGEQGEDSRFVDQSLDCSTGWFSNNNLNTNPYLAFDDFRADGNPLLNVRFYGGVYDASTFGNGSLNNIVSIGIDIFTTQTSSDPCGWTYGSLVARQVYSLAELAPTFTCSGSFYDAYEFTANFSSPVALNSGQVYMVTVYATMADPNGNFLFTWNQSFDTNYRDATSWDRTTGDYIRCGPDQAFATNVQSDCFENDCQTTCWFSNYFSNANPYIALDDFTARATGDLRRLQFTGGVYDLGTGTGDLLGNISGFYIEVYTGGPNGNFPCGNFVETFLGAFQVSKADARPVFDCIDIFGIPHYTFTVDIPPGIYSLAAGDVYHLGVYGVQTDINSTEIFCWGGTDAVYGLTSWSYNLDNSAQEICHDPDQAFCINPPRPCLGDFNKDGLRNTQDVTAFLNAWNARHPSADINGDGVINTQDVSAFLNRWNIPC